MLRYDTDIVGCSSRLRVLATRVDSDGLAGLRSSRVNRQEPTSRIGRLGSSLRKTTLPQEILLYHFPDLPNTAMQRGVVHHAVTMSDAGILQGFNNDVRSWLAHRVQTPARFLPQHAPNHRFGLVLECESLNPTARTAHSTSRRRFSRRPSCPIVAV
jgi:hypothetical protein